MFEVFQYVNFLISVNTGFAQIRGINVATVYTPTVLILGYGLASKKIVFPFLKLFLVTVVLFLLIEFYHSLYSHTVFKNEFIIRLIQIYLCYCILIAILNQFGSEFVMRWSIIFGLGLSLLILGSYTNLYTGHNQSFDIAQSDTFERAGVNGSSINVNILSFKAVITFILMIAYYDRFGNPVKSKVLFAVLSLLLFSEVLIHASRGAFISFILMVLIIIWKKGNFGTFFIGSFALLSLLLFSYDIILEQFSSLQIYDRLDEDINKVSRIVQLRANLANFIQHPFIGVGYDNAARGYSEDIVRSNFTWAQIMASHGIFYMFLYIFFLFKLFVYESGLLKNIVPLMVGIFILVNLSTQRPFNYLALLALLSYHEYALKTAPSRDEEEDLVPG